MLQRYTCRAKLPIQTIIAEFDRTGTSPGQQQHTHKISAVKRKGDHPSFSQQRSNTNAPKARDDGRATSNKKKPKKSKGKGKQAHFVEHEPAPTPFSLAALAVRLTIALQPSWAGPSTMTIASINPNRVMYSMVATSGPQKFTGVPKKAGPNTLQKERGLLKRMDVTPMIQNLKTMSLEQRLESPPPVPTMAPEAISLANQILNPIEHLTPLRSLDPLSQGSMQWYHHRSLICQLLLKRRWLRNQRKW